MDGAAGEAAATLEPNDNARPGARGTAKGNDATNADVATDVAAEAAEAADAAESAEADEAEAAAALP